ncbi:MAG: adenylate/guanylate cyclase domain-containing protein [Betaproteobacteria bacterium]
MRLATPRHWQNYASALRFGAILSAFFGALAGAATFKPPLLGAAMVGVSGLVDGTTVMALIGATEIFLPRTRLGQWLQQRPFLAALGLKTVLYSAILAGMLYGQLGPRVAVSFLEGEQAAAIQAQFDALQIGLLASLAGYITLLLIMLRQTTQLVGERTARAVILGRYHRPRMEERFFLFIDIVGSTPVAEKLGALSVHRYLNRIFQEAADPIDDSHGEVYQYVGDEIVVTWLVEEGRAGAKPLACLFGIVAALARAEKEFEKEFGTVPKLRAALHAGEVVTGEAGGPRRAIVFHGDVMNATSRIENLTRELGHPFLVSEDALARMEGREAYALEDLGMQALRGKDSGVRVYAVARGGASLPG